MSRRFALTLPLRALLGFALWTFAIAQAHAGITVRLDSRTLNDVLASVAVQEVQVPLTAETAVRVLLEDLEIVGFEPGAGRQGTILTSLVLRVPALGMSARVNPRLSLSVAEVASRSVLEVRFEEVRLALPLKSLDIARFLAPMRFPAESLFQLAGATGDVNIRSRLDKVQMLDDGLQFEMSLIVQPPGSAVVDPPVGAGN